MSRQAAEKARSAARRCTCTHRKDAHVSRLVPVEGKKDDIVHWCRDCDAPCDFTATTPGLATTARTCKYPHKRAYGNAEAANAAADRLRANKSGSGLTAEAFECVAGHWHVGRRSTPGRRP